MDAPLKERLTGALILVAALVIVVPEMLSGPGSPPNPAEQAGDAGPPVRTYSLELGTSTATLTQDQSSLTPQSAEPVEAPAAQPESPVTQAETGHEPEPNSVQPPEPSEPAPASAAQPVADAAPPADVKQPRVAEAPDAAPATGQWWSQLGSFSSRDNAERLARDLRGKGYSISVAKIKVAGKDLYRVRAGPVASREAAVALQTRLAAAGHKSSLVAP